MEILVLWYKFTFAICRKLDANLSITKYFARVNQGHFGGKRGSRRHSTTGFSKNSGSGENKLSQMLQFYHFAFGRGLKSGCQ